MSFHKILFLVCLTPWLSGLSAQDVETTQAPDTLRLRLDEAIQIALTENPTVRVADYDVEIKKEARREARAGLLPEASLSASYSRTLKKQTMVMEFGGQSTKIQMGTDNSYSAGLSINLPLFAPALYRSIRLTEADIELAVEKARASRIGMVNEVTKAFYQLLLAQDSYRVLQEAYAQAEANLRIVNERFTLGSVSEYDRIRADVQVRSLKPGLVSAGNGVALAGLQLRVLLGVAGGPIIAARGSLADYESAMKPDQPIAETLENNSDLRQLDLNLELLSRNERLTKANFLPTIGASYSYSYSSMNNDFRIRDYTWNPYSFVALNVNIPLFKASNYPKLRKVRLQMQQLRETRLNAERQLGMLVQNARDKMAAAYEQQASNREGVAQAEKGRLIARKRYEVGMGTILELNDAEVALTQAELAYRQAIYDYLTARADLEKTLGNNDLEHTINQK